MKDESRSPGATGGHTREYREQNHKPVDHAVTGSNSAETADFTSASDAPEVAQHLSEAGFSCEQVGTRQVAVDPADMPLTMEQADAMGELGWKFLQYGREGAIFAPESCWDAVRAERREQR